MKVPLRWIPRPGERFDADAVAGEQAVHSLRNGDREFFFGAEGAGAYQSRAAPWFKVVIPTAPWRAARKRLPYHLEVLRLH